MNATQERQFRSKVRPISPKEVEIEGRVCKIRKPMELWRIYFNGDCVGIGMTRDEAIRDAIVTFTM